MNLLIPHHSEHHLAGAMPIGTAGGPAVAGRPGESFILLAFTLGYCRTEPNAGGDRRRRFYLNILYSIALIGGLALILSQLGWHRFNPAAILGLAFGIEILILVLLSRALPFSISDLDFTVAESRRKANIRLGLRNYTFAYALVTAISECLKLYSTIKVSNNAEILGIAIVAGLLSLKFTKWVREPVPPASPQA